MKKIALLLFLIPLTGIAQQHQKNFIDQNFIEVTGTVESEIIPNEIYISISINEKDKKGKIGVEEQETKMIQQLKNIGINTEKHLTIDNFNSHYVSYFLRKNGILKKKQYTLLVNDTQKLAKAFRVFDALEISTVYVSKVDHSNIKELKLAAKIEAIKIAKKKAQAYAKAINQTTGKALFIAENNTVNHVNSYLYGSRASNIIIRGNSSLSQKNSLDKKINFKKITITASVEAKFELL